MRSIRRSRVRLQSISSATCSAAPCSAIDAAAWRVIRSSVRGEPLSFSQLASWQQRVLGSDAPPSWRTTDAFARHVRYAYSPDVPARFDAAVVEANGTDDVAVRAVRVYLDICFFHHSPTATRAPPASRSITCSRVRGSDYTRSTRSS
jgi:hypothetical protein